MIREGVMEKTWKTWFTSSCCFFSVCHIGRIPPFNELQKCPFFSYPWICFLRKFGSFKRYDIPNFHPPPSMVLDLLVTYKKMFASSTFQVRGDFHWKNPNKWWVDRSVSRKHLRQCRPSILGKPESRRMRCKKRISQPQSGSTNNWGWVPRDV